MPSLATKGDASIEPPWSCSQTRGLLSRRYGLGVVGRSRGWDATGSPDRRRHRRVVHDPLRAEAVRLGRPHLAGRAPRRHLGKGIAALRPRGEVVAQDRLDRSSRCRSWRWPPPPPSGRICGRGSLLGQTGSSRPERLRGGGGHDVSGRGLGRPPQPRGARRRGQGSARSGWSGQCGWVSSCARAVRPARRVEAQIVRPRR